MLLEPKEIAIKTQGDNGKIFVISKFPAVQGLEISSLSSFFLLFRVVILSPYTQQVIFPKLAITQHLKKQC